MKISITNTDNINEIQQKTGPVTAKYWPTESVKVIAMKDGTFVLGIDVQFENEYGHLCYETCRIMLDENNVPYVDVGADQGFDEKTCQDKVSYIRYSNSSGYRNVVQGYPILTLDDGMHVSEKSVFKFVGDCREEPTIREYFSGYYRTAGLNKKGLSLIVKYVEDPANKGVISERTRRPDEKEVANMQQELKDAMDAFLNGTVDEYKIKRMVEVYKLITEGNGMLQGAAIECDFVELEKTLTKPQGQPQ